ncbi:MAG: hypothetical protein M3O62_13085 [Pseudomonadota bacterium]|nr:hypothetical protein [Pseudomonadota bacterium]
MLSMLGLKSQPAEGDQILPGTMGRFTNFNANGKVIVRKDLPKVPESFMVWRRWNDWHGNPHSGVQYRTMDIYHRQRIPAPFEYLTAVSTADGMLFSSRVLSIDDDLEENIVHVLNVFLEIFQTLTISPIDLQVQSAVNVRKLHWKILPPGQHPFDLSRKEVSDFVQTIGAEHRTIVEHRIEHIAQHKPDFLAIGVGGFSDYIVFGFNARALYVLESPALGNATYVFQNDWETISQLTKKQVISEGLHHARIVHNRAWARGLRQVLTDHTR